MQVKGTLFEKAVVEGTLVEGTVAISANEKVVVEESVLGDTVNKKLEIDKILFKWLGIESLW